MLIWYKDDKLKIEFDREPNIIVQYPKPSYATSIKKEIIHKPFYNCEDLVVLITYKEKEHPFFIPKGYTWDGASIPSIFWRFIGPNTSPDFLIPSLIHDVLCENHNYIENDRYLSTLILERLLYVSGVGCFKRWMMKHSVDNYQKIKGNWK